MGNLAAMRRHFTVSGFVVEGDSTLLHWHTKLQIWLPPGGHIEPDEDPVQAVVREVLEETGITAEVVPHTSEHAFSNLPQLASPLSIIVADVGASAGEPAHQHIDMCYALRPLAGVARIAPEADHGFVLVSAEQLRREEHLLVASCGVDMPVPDDVRVLALRSIGLVCAAGQTTGLQPTTHNL
jgi:8-oxo-dGTP pyrophosphatase MutT (NUDIX family)